MTYTRDLEDWHDFVRKTPDEYEAWVKGVTKECEISDIDHVLIMLADPDISVNLFFNRPDKDKQFLYRLLMEEDNPIHAMANFRQCLARINSRQNYDAFYHSGFRVIVR